MVDETSAVAGTWRFRDAAALSAEDAAAVRAAAAETERADGVEPIGDGPVRSLDGGPDVLHILATAGGLLPDGNTAEGSGGPAVSGDPAVSGGGAGSGAAGRLLGYANVASPGGSSAMIEAFVRPEARGRGIGAALVGRAWAAAGPDGRAWAHGAGRAADAVADGLGLVPVRELLQMSRPLDDPERPLPALRPPEGIRIRTYAESDASELLRVNNAAFSWHPEQGGMRSDDLADEAAQPWFDPDGIFLAFAEDAPARLLGFHWTKVHRPGQDQAAGQSQAAGQDQAAWLGTPSPLGEVYVVGVDPAAQGGGLGGLLTLAGLHHLQASGIREVMLYVEGDNAAAVATYERLGFARSRVDLAYGRPGASA